MNPVILWVIRGLPFGLANVLPGISGGTIALLLGFYQELIISIKEVHLPILLPMAFGTVISVIIGATVVDWSLTNYPQVTYSLLLGLVLASVKVACNGLPLRKPSRLWLYFLAGVVLAFLLAGISNGEGAQDPAFYQLILAGILASTAMLVPGVSGSSLLIMTGHYHYILQAVAHFQWSVLLLVAVGVLLGIFGLAYILSWLLSQAPQVTRALLAGLILGSSRMLPVSLADFWSLVMIGSGFIAVLVLENRLKRINMSKARL